MLKHEQFEEICAAAAVGQASAAELGELERHASVCVTCREEYSKCLDLAARQFAAMERIPELSADETEACFNSEGFARRFFERAEQEGINFSRHATEEGRGILPASLAFWRRPRPAWWIPVLAPAAAAILLIVTSGLYLQERATQTTKQAGLRVQDKSPAPAASSNDFNQRLSDLNNANVKLESQVQQLATELRDADRQLQDADSHLSKLNGDLDSTAQDRGRVTIERDALAARLQDLQQQLAASEAQVSATNQQLAALRSEANMSSAELASADLKIHDLTDQLEEQSVTAEKERQLLSMGHDVTDLMGARNLHIVDVVDTDPRGKNRPAFGRVFFTEGKSLVFYAFDLDEAKVEKAGYQYRIWAKQERQDSHVQSLGMFYSDDKTERRWVFKCNDPKVLNEIDSVFVTLEPSNADPVHPKGSELMYAYLRGQPNHP